MFTIIALVIISFMLGVLSTGCFIFSKKFVGKLMVNQIDPEDEPYLFLDLDKSVSYISRTRYILLEVDLKKKAPPRKVETRR
jgi:hypothetical protein